MRVHVKDSSKRRAPGPAPQAKAARPFPWVIVVLLLLPILLALLFLPGTSSRIPEEPVATRSSRAPTPRAPSRGDAPPRGISPDSPAREIASANSSAEPARSADPPPREGLAEETLAGKTLWERRVIRARLTLENYLESTKYPFSSQPIERHRDMEKPNFVGSVKLPLVTRDKTKTTDAKVTLNQDRALLQGNEAVVLRIACEGSEGPVPCVFSQPAVAFPPADMRGAQKITPASVPFAPENGDPTSMIATFTPAKQGFAGYEGPIFIEGHLKIGSEEGSTSWQVTYTPAAPAIFTKKFREVVENGSLSIYVGLQVDKPGRYVITARGATKEGKVFAFLQFNEELKQGSTEAKLQVFGKLIHDTKAGSPFLLRDVEGFLLRDGMFPDRELMAMLPGDVFTTKAYPAKTFSEAEWESEEKTRHVEHYKEELKNAQDGLEKEKAGGGAGEAAEEKPAP